jgi:hypothetical protein
MSPATGCATFIDGVTKAMLSSLDTFKAGAFRTEINNKMGIITIFNVMLESSVVTAEEKKILRLSRDLTAPFKSAPCMDDIHCRVGRYLKDVVLIFFGGKKIEFPPIQVIKPDGTADFALKMGGDGRPVQVPAGPPVVYPSLEMGQDIGPHTVLFLVGRLTVLPCHRSCHFIPMAWGESQTTAGRTSQSETEADKQGQEGKH